MKAKTIVILIVVALLCTSIASAGFFDWITGQAFSLKSIFQKKAAATTASPVEKPAAVSPAEVSPSAATPTEFDSVPVTDRGDVLLVHFENRVRQMEQNLAMVDEKAEFSNTPAARPVSDTATATNVQAAEPVAAKKTSKFSLKSLLGVKA